MCACLPYVDMPPAVTYVKKEVAISDFVCPLALSVVCPECVCVPSVALHSRIYSAAALELVRRGRSPHF
jgi:hypothetical protein